MTRQRFSAAGLYATNANLRLVNQNDKPVNYPVTLALAAPVELTQNATGQKIYLWGNGYLTKTPANGLVYFNYNEAKAALMKNLQTQAPWYADYTLKLAGEFNIADSPWNLGQGMNAPYERIYFKVTVNANGQTAKSLEKYLPFKVKFWAMTNGPEAGQADEYYGYSSYIPAKGTAGANEVVETLQIMVPAAAYSSPLPSIIPSFRTATPLPSGGISSPYPSPRSPQPSALLPLPSILPTTTR